MEFPFTGVDQHETAQEAADAPTVHPACGKVREDKQGSGREANVGAAQIGSVRRVKKTVALVVAYLGQGYLVSGLVHCSIFLAPDWWFIPKHMGVNRRILCRSSYVLLFSAGISV